MVAFLKLFVISNLGISLALGLLGLLIGWRWRRHLREQWLNADRRWRIVGRAALILQVVLFLWVSLLDYWRQLLGLLMTVKTAGYSDPYTAAPILARHTVSEPVRAISLLLIFLGALGLALLIERAGVGPFPALALIVIGGFIFALLSDARWRMELWASNGVVQLGRGTTSDLLVDATFFTFLVTFNALVTLLCYLVLTGLLALPVMVISGFLRARLRQPDPHDQAFAALLRARAAEARKEVQRLGDEQ